MLRTWKVRGTLCNMSVYAIVPVKPFAESKSRLAPVLSPAERLALSRKLLVHTLTVLSQTRQIDAVVVVSRDPEVHRLAVQHEATALSEQSEGLNLALVQATTWTARQGAAAVLIVPADLPLLTSSALEAIIRLGERGPAVVIAPDRHDRGTNLLLVRPPGLIDYAFGLDSFHVHRRQAAARGANLHVFRSRETQLDVDTPDDLGLYSLPRALH